MAFGRAAILGALLPNRCPPVKIRPTLAFFPLALMTAMLASPAHAERPDTRDRSKIAAEYRWDFSAIYPDWAAWEAGLAAMEAKMDAFAARKGTLATGPQAVLDAYRAFDDIGKLQYLAFRYPQLQRDVDTRDQAVSGRFQRVGAMLSLIHISEPTRPY